MKKFITTLCILLAVAICTVSLAVFAACDSGEKLDSNTIYITVLDENGNPIDGPNFGEQDWTDGVAQVQIQFCTVSANDGGCAAYTAGVDANGKAEFPRSSLTELNANGDVLVELHVLNVTVKKGYVKEYFQYKISEVPQTITVTLKKA